MIAQAHQHYSREDDEKIKALWPDLVALADALGRTRSSVRSRGYYRLGLRCPSGKVKHLFTDRECQIIRDRYPAEGAIPIAAALGRAVADIVSKAQRMDVRFSALRRWTDRDDAELMLMNKRGLPIRVIGEQLDRSYSAVAKRMELIGISRPGPDRGKVIEKYRTIQKPCDASVAARWARERIALGEHGWPPDLNPKEVAILESLRKIGPQSRKNLAISIGEPADRNPKKFLMTHGGICATGRIMARGLVCRLTLEDRRQKVNIYSLTQMAMKQRGTYGSVEKFNHAAANRGNPMRKYQ